MVIFRFKDLKIGMKLTLGFGFLILMCVIVCFVGINGERTTFSKSQNLSRLKDIQKNLLEARFNMRSFSALKDTQWYVKARNNMSDAIFSLDSLKSRLTLKENIQLATDLEKWLKTYDTLMLRNKILTMAQEKIYSRVNDESNKFLEDLKARGVPETHPVQYYFAIVRVNVLLILVHDKEEYHRMVKESIQKVKEKLETIKNGGDLDLQINRFEASIDEYMGSSSQINDLQPLQLVAGKNALTISKRMNDITYNYVTDFNRRTIVFSLLFSLIAILAGSAISYIIARYFILRIKRGAKLAEIYASGLLTESADGEDLLLKDEIGDLMRSLSSMGKKIEEIVRNISKESFSVMASSQEITDTTQQLSTGASEQASSVEEVSSAMEEMTSNVISNNEHAQEAEKMAINASQKMNDVATATRNSLSSVREITGKIGIINDIAFQTNLLALNAAVEAARAGEQGKGFAVVAAEVRKLAERSKLAANEIVSLSQTSLKATEKAEKLMLEVMPQIEKNASHVKEISSASLEQNTGAEQVNYAIQQLNNVAQQNAAAAEELATNAEELTRQAEQLNNIVSYFKV